MIYNSKSQCVCVLKGTDQFNEDSSSFTNSHIERVSFFPSHSTKYHKVWVYLKNNRNNMNKPASSLYPNTNSTYRIPYHAERWKCEKEIICKKLRPICWQHISFIHSFIHFWDFLNKRIHKERVNIFRYLKYTQNTKCYALV